MPWGAAVAAVGVAANMKAAGDAADAQNAATAGQLSMSQQELDFAKQQYEDYKNLYGDLEESMVAEVEAYNPEERLQRYRGEAMTEVTRAFDKQKEETRRQNMRYGLDPTQARFQETESEMGRSKALAEVEAMNRARQLSEAEDDKMFARKLAVGQFGKGLPGAAEAVSSATRAAGDVYGRQSAAYGMDARNAASNAGKAGQQLGYWGMKYANQPSTNTDSGGFSYTPEDSWTGELGW